MRRHYHETVLTNLPFGVRFYTSDVTTSGYVPLHWHIKILTVCFCEDAPLAPSANETIKDVLSYIGEHYAEKLTVDELARVAGYNGNYLSRLFHETTGKTLISYIYEVRLTHFYEGLVRTEMDIGQLMEQNGLKNQRTAREMFLKLYGQRPLAVRKRSRERR